MITNGNAAICFPLKAMFKENYIGVERSLDLNLRNEKDRCKKLQIFFFALFFVDI